MYLRNFLSHFNKVFTKAVCLVMVFTMLVPMELASIAGQSLVSYATGTGSDANAGYNGWSTSIAGILSFNTGWKISVVIDKSNEGRFSIDENHSYADYFAFNSIHGIGEDAGAFFICTNLLNKNSDAGIAWASSTGPDLSSSKLALEIATFLGENSRTSARKNISNLGNKELQGNLFVEKFTNILSGNDSEYTADAFINGGWEKLLNKYATDSSLKQKALNNFKYLFSDKGTNEFSVRANLEEIWNDDGYDASNIAEWRDNEAAIIKNKAEYLDFLFQFYLTMSHEGTGGYNASRFERVRTAIESLLKDNINSVGFTVKIEPLVSITREMRFPDWTCTIMTTEDFVYQMFGIHYNKAGRATYMKSLYEQYKASGANSFADDRSGDGGTYGWASWEGALEHMVNEMVRLDPNYPRISNYAFGHYAGEQKHTEGVQIKDYAFWWASSAMHRNYYTTASRNALKNNYFKSYYRGYGVATSTHQYLYFYDGVSNNNKVSTDASVLNGSSNQAMYGYITLNYTFVTPTGAIGKIDAKPDLPTTVNVVETKYKLGKDVTLDLISGLKDESEISSWRAIIKQAKATDNFEGFKVKVNKLERTCNYSGFSDQTFSPVGEDWLSERVLTIDEMEKAIDGTSPLRGQLVDQTAGYVVIPPSEGQDPLEIKFTYNMEMTVTAKLGNSSTKDSVFEAKIENRSDTVTFIVTPENPDYTRYRYVSTPEAYAELKNYGKGSNQSGTLVENWEVMAGVPTTEQLYYAAGGSEFIIDISFQYDKDETAVRSYTSHMTGTTCEYMDSDSLHATNATDSTAEKDFVSKNNEGTSTEKYNGYKPEGAQSYTVNINQHTNSTTITATWSGSIANSTSRPSATEYKDNTVSGSCPGMSASGGNLLKMSTPTTNWDTAAYNKAIEQAKAWVDKYEATNNTFTFYKKSSTDEIERIWKIGNASIVVTLSGGTASYSNTFSGTGSYRGGTYTSGNILTAKTNSNDSARLGSGWSYYEGVLTTVSGASGCAHGCTATGSKSNPHSHDHSCQSTNPGTSASDGANAGYSYTITVNFDNGTLDAHELCGPCCSHYLPNIYDTWSQSWTYDTMRITDVHIWRIDQAAASGLADVIGPGVDNNVDYTISSVTGNEGPYENPNGIDDGVVGASIKTNPPNIFYNIAMLNSNNLPGNDSDVTFKTQDGIGKATESSLVGRIRYSIDPTQHDEVYYYLGTRTNHCDGMAKTYDTNVTAGGGKGQTQEWADGFLYDGGNFHGTATVLGTTNSPNVAAADLKSNRANNGTEPNRDDNNFWTNPATNYTTIGQTKFPLNDLYGLKKRVSGKDAAYASWLETTPSEADANVDVNTEEYTKFLEKREQPITATMMTDFLILQTTSGDQCVLYYQIQNEPTELVTTGGTWVDRLITKVELVVEGDNVTKKETIIPNDSIPSDTKTVPVTAETKIPNTELTVEDLYHNNANSAYDWEPEDINVGGYNGNYSSPANKFKGTGNNEKTATFVDKDPANTIVRPTRPTKRLMLYSLPLNIITEIDNEIYLDNGLNSEVFWTNDVHWTDITAKSLGTKNNPMETGLSYSTDVTVGEDVDFDFSNLGDAWDASIQTIWAHQYNDGLINRRLFTDADRDKWGWEAKSYTGFVLATKYSKNHKIELNSLIIQDPIASQEYSLISLPDSRDQRYANKLGAGYLDSIMHDNLTCSGSAADCEFATLNCEYGKSKVLAEYYFTNNTTINSVTENSFTLPSGWTLYNNYLRGRDPATRIAIPMVAELGTSYSGGQKIQVRAVVNLLNLNGHDLVEGGIQYGGLLASRISQMVFSFANYGLYVSTEGRYGFITSDGQYRECNNIVVQPGTSYTIEAVFSMASLEGCSLKINGQTATFTSSAVHFNQLQSGDIGNNFYIGAMENCSYGFRGAMDSIVIKRLPGSYEHSSECYIYTETHPTGLNTHVHTKECLETGELSGTFEVLNYDGKKYVKILDHNLAIGGLFSNMTEAAYCTAKGKLSLLSMIDELKANGNYQFLLYYPEMGKMNIWQQSVNPMNYTDNSGTGAGFAPGYQPIKIEMSDNYWGGLERGASGSLLDGSVDHANWWYAVGSVRNYGGPYTIPGGNSTTVGHVQLYLLASMNLPGNEVEVQLPQPTIYNYSYTGGVQTVTLPAGTYKLETWGAQGGYYLTGNNANNSNGVLDHAGGLGGYATGVVTFTKSTKLYIFVGQRGIAYADGGSAITYNGGGQGRAGGGDGGGMTHISTTNNPATSTFTATSSGNYTVTWVHSSGCSYSGQTHVSTSTSSNPSTCPQCSHSCGTKSVVANTTYIPGGSWNSSGTLIVAGGGGGSDQRGAGGYGGGTTGGTAGGTYDTALNNGLKIAATGGSQTAGGLSAYGTDYNGGAGYGASSIDGGGGGAGWYGGGAGAYGESGGGGGSSYVGGVTNGKTLAGNASMPAPSGGTETGHSGNGYARITKLDTPANGHQTSTGADNGGYTYYKSLYESGNLSVAQLKALFGDAYYDLFEQAAYYKEFTGFNASNIGSFTSTYSCDLSTYSGKLIQSITGVSPSFILNTSVETNLVDQLTIKLSNKTAATKAKIYFSNNTTFTEAKSVTTVMEANTDNQEIHFNLADNTNWTGTQQYFKICIPAENDINYGNSIHYSSIGFEYRPMSTKDFGYTGSVQNMKVPVSGYYLIETWGASGGNSGAKSESTVLPSNSVGAWNLQGSTTNTNSAWTIPTGSGIHVHTGHGGIANNALGDTWYVAVYGANIHQDFRLTFANSTGNGSWPSGGGTVTNTNIGNGVVTYTVKSTTSNPYLAFLLYNQASGVTSTVIKVVVTKDSSTSTASSGGLGGYTAGVLKLNAGETIYAYVGGQGQYSANGGTGGGYNGGGNGGLNAFGGGGMTHISRVGTDSIYNTSQWTSTTTVRKDANGVEYKAGYKIERAYTGAVQSVMLAKGTWLVELYGAQGGDGRNDAESATITANSGGYGGKASAVLSPASDTTYFVYVGGKGGSAPYTKGSFGVGGYNGGGPGGADLNDNVGPENGAGGGGMTHLSTVSTDVISATRATYASQSKAGQTYPTTDFTYTGGVQTTTLPAGTYKLEVWGAQGGTTSHYAGGKGGYSYGTITLGTTTTLYIVVGGQGALGHSNSTGDIVAGGYNGGGQSLTCSNYSYYTGASGGGATHIGLKTGLLTTFSSDYSTNLLLVAGGGGAGANYNPAGVGGYGGGANGGSGTQYGSYGYGTGGSQTAGGQNAYGGSGNSGMGFVAASFGQGGYQNVGTSASGGWIGGGGGGGFYGGGAGGAISSGGGGSGYVNTTKLTSASTVAGNTSFTAPGGGTETGHTGNGYARITQISGAGNTNASDVVYESSTPGTSSVTLQPGRYYIQTWGAQGGNASLDNQGGRGGYSYGILEVNTATTIQTNIGGHPGYAHTAGINGGGTGGTYGAGGGGATDIRMGGTALANRIIVAGGGGGAAVCGSLTSTSNNNCCGYQNGGYGGGTSGGRGQYSSNWNSGGAGATQTSGNALGVGGSNTGYGAGGGGGYYGGYAGATSDHYGGGGGSGYVNTSVLSNAGTMAGNTTFPQYSGGTTTGVVGNGAIRITRLDSDIVTETINFNTAAVILAAGGGGGADAVDTSSANSAGKGGGTAGTAVNSHTAGGTQTSGYKQGLGAPGQSGAVDTNIGGHGGGGGGWWGANDFYNHTSTSTCCGAGGSGYINTSMVTNGTLTANVRSGNGLAVFTLQADITVTNNSISSSDHINFNTSSVIAVAGGGGGADNAGGTVGGADDGSGGYGGGLESGHALIDGTPSGGNGTQAPGTIAYGSYSASTPYCYYQGNTSCGSYGKYAYTAGSTMDTSWCHYQTWTRVPQYDHTSLSTNATQGSGYKQGLGMSPTKYTDTGGGGGGWWGGKSSNHNNGGGGGGSGYVGLLTSYTSRNGTTYTAQTICGNQVMPNYTGGTMVGNNGNGYARITYIEEEPAPFPTLEEIFEVIDKLPNNSNLFRCTHDLNTHVCDALCKEVVTLNCLEPHHSGDHYAGNEICYDACNDDSKHKPNNLDDLSDGTFTAGNFINLDWGFNIFYTNTGDFYQSSVLGIGSPTNTRGKGFVNDMNTSTWTRVKEVRFPVNVIYKDKLYLAGEWIRLADKGQYLGEDGSPYNEENWTNFGTEKYLDLNGQLIDGVRSYKYHFYCVEANNEYAGVTMAAQSFAINNEVLDPDHCEWERYPTYVTNRLRVGSQYESIHSTYNEYYIDVVGRIGNLAIIDTADYRFSNFFKKPIDNTTAVPEPTTYTVSSGQVVVSGGAVKSGSSIVADAAGEGAKLSGAYLNPGTYRIYVKGSGLTDGVIGVTSHVAWTPVYPDAKMKLTIQEAFMDTTDESGNPQRIPVPGSDIYTLEGPGVSLEAGSYLIEISGSNLDSLKVRVQDGLTAIDSYVTDESIRTDTITLAMTVPSTIHDLQIIGTYTGSVQVSLIGAKISKVSDSGTTNLVSEGKVTSVSVSDTSRTFDVMIDVATPLDIVMSSNGLPITVESIALQQLADASNNWIVEGIVSEVNAGAQNNYLTWIYDIRGVLVQGGHYIDTYHTLGWARTAKCHTTIPLDASQNNIYALRNDGMLAGYATYFSINTIGNYWANNASCLQMIPEYYAINVKTGVMEPVDVYINYNNSYFPVNIWGMVTDEDKYTWGGTGSGYDINSIYNYVSSLEWPAEYTRRMVTNSENYMTTSIQDLLRSASGNLLIPGVSRYITGNAQFNQLDGRARTFVGGETTYDELMNYSSGGRAASSVYEDSHGIWFNPAGRIPAYRWWQQSQRWHLTLQVPSSSVFIKAGEECTLENIAKYKTSDWVILATADIRALGQVWNLYYAVNNGELRVVDDNGTVTAVDIPNYININGHTHRIPVAIAVYQTTETPPDDIDIISRH